MIVVSNTSPLINLAAIGHLERLRDLYGTIYIPVAVYDEIVVYGAGLAGSEEVRDAEQSTAGFWISQPLYNFVLNAMGETP